MRSDGAVDTLILSVEDSNLNCCTVLAWAMFLVLAVVLLDIFYLKSVRLCDGPMFDIISGRMNCHYAAAATIAHPVPDFFKNNPLKL